MSACTEEPAAVAPPPLGFGGIRIEENVLVTGGDPEVLTADIPT